MGDKFIRGEWSVKGCHEDVNREEHRGAARALNTWRDVARDKLVIARRGNSAAAVYAMCGAGSSPSLMVVA